MSRSKLYCVVPLDHSLRSAPFAHHRNPSSLFTLADPLPEQDRLTRASHEITLLKTELGERLCALVSPTCGAAADPCLSPLLRTTSRATRRGAALLVQGGHAAVGGGDAASRATRAHRRYAGHFYRSGMSVPASSACRLSFLLIAPAPAPDRFGEAVQADAVAAHGQDHRAAGARESAAGPARSVRECRLGIAVPHRSLIPPSLPPHARHRHDASIAGRDAYASGQDDP